MGVLGAGELVGDGDVIFSQLLEAAVVVHVLLDLGSLVLGDAFGEFLPPDEALDEIVGAALGGVESGGGEKLATGASQFLKGA